MLTPVSTSDAGDVGDELTEVGERMENGDTKTFCPRLWQAPSLEGLPLLELHYHFITFPLLCSLVINHYHPEIQKPKGTSRPYSYTYLTYSPPLHQEGPSLRILRRSASIA